MGNKKQGPRINLRFAHLTYAGENSGPTQTTTINLSQLREQREAMEKAQELKLRALTTSANQGYEPVDADSMIIDEDLCGADETHGYGSDGQMEHVQPRRRNDRRKRAQCNTMMYTSWDDQLPMLVAGYLQWCFGDMLPAREEPELGYFEVTAVGITGRVEYRRIVQHPGERANVALIRHRQSSFSLQAMAKVLCALHNVEALQEDD
ncbi:hypothetical protein K439DRAFT_1611527 [Ramaria rubella]|nr:hypothetical protein K439DRAFT_1611527 [Ramaria rubella]